MPTYMRTTRGTTLALTVYTMTSTSEQKPNLILSGFMGTGKTTIGRILAERLDMEFVDTDMLIETEAGTTVSEIFAKQGEPAFRKLESALCERLGTYQGHIIATGGGALLDPANRVALENTGIVVLLTCESQQLRDRLEESARRGERPLLRRDLEQTINNLLEQREPVYSTFALKVDTTNLTPEEAADAVLHFYQNPPPPE